MKRWKNTTVDRLSAKHFLNNTGTYIVLILAVFGLTFFGIFPQQGDRGGLSGVAAQVGSLQITSNDFRSSYQNTHQQYQNQYGGEFDAIKFNLSEKVLNRLVDEASLFLAARSLGIQATEQDVINYLTEIDAFRDKDGKFSPKFYQSFLRRNRYSEEAFMAGFVQDLTLAKLRKFVINFVFASQAEARVDYQLENSYLDIEFVKVAKDDLQMTIAKDDIDTYLASERGQTAVKTYYDSHQQEFNQPAQVEASHVLIAYQGARNVSGDAGKRSKDEARKIADDVQRRSQSEDFTALAKKFSDEPQAKEKGGNLGFFTRDAMVKEFSDVAFDLEVGKVSKVIETAFGFHIIKVTGKKAEVNQQLEQARMVIAQKLLRREKVPRFAGDLARQLLEQLNTGNAEQLLNSHSLQRDSTGNFALTTRHIPKLGSKMGDRLYGLDKEKFVLHEQDGDFYLLRLKNKSPAEMSKFQAKDTKVNEYIAYYRGGELYNYLEKQARKLLEDANDIWMNEKFLHFDRDRLKKAQPSS